MRKYFLIFFSFSFFLAGAQQNKALVCISQMLDSIRNVKTLRANIRALERINKGFLSASSEIKILTSPRKLYFINREKKLEILYVTGEFGNKAVVKPHVFPYLTLTLDPRSNIMRKNQHYTIHELGFEFIGRTIGLVLSKEKDNMARSLAYLGKHERNGYNCHMVVYETKTFPYYEYTVQKKETVTSIAYKQNVNDYMLRIKNNLHNDFGYLKEGTKIQIPYMYCKKAILYLDENSMLPVSVSIYDDVGLFESYDFSDIRVNKPIDPEEFSKDYKDYGF